MSEFTREDTKRRTLGWAVHNSEKSGWRGDGILPSPAMASRSSLLGSVLSFIREKTEGSLSSPRSPTNLTSRGETQKASMIPSLATIRFMLLCSLWYMSSAMSSNTGKVIMNAYRYPVTLTIIQFGFVATYSAIFCQPFFGMTTMRKPTRAIMRSTVPMAVFQVGGHVFSSVAISRIPVSTVHTIKALSPMFTVAAYAALFGVKYSPATYISLLPLTAGVMLACSFDVSASDFIGLLSAFCSALVFVSSNIFFKKVMPTPQAKSGLSTPASAHKLDKLNLLLYSSGLAFIMMIPIWVFTDLPVLLSSDSPAAKTNVSVSYYYFLNGTVHFGQNIIAFVILGSTSPVTYSIAALVKRIAVICIAVVWFAQKVHPVQGMGICLTFVGLWMYNNAKGDVEKGEKKMRRVEAQMEGLLPNTAKDGDLYRSSSPLSPILESTHAPFGLSSAQPRPAYVQQTSNAVTDGSLANGGHMHPYHHSHPRHPHAPPPLNLGNLDATKNAVSSPTGSYPSPPPSVGPTSSPPPFYQTGAIAVKD